MATDIPMPGTGQSVDPTDPMGAGKTLLMLALGFGLTAGVASAGVSLWNRAADQTDRFDEINLV